MEIIFATLPTVHTVSFHEKNAKAYEIISYIIFNYYVYLFQKIEISFFHLENENAEGVNGAIPKRMFHKINELIN